MALIKSSNQKAPIKNTLTLCSFRLIVLFIYKAIIMPSIVMQCHWVNFLLDNQLDTKLLKEASPPQLQKIESC